MAVFSFRRVQNIPGASDKVWSFFVDAANLPLITPPYMQFRILSSGGGPPPSADSAVRDSRTTFNDSPASGDDSSASGGGSLPHSGIPVNSGSHIYAGQLIEYKLRPLPGFWVYWMTEITHVRDGLYFVDEQRRGPYRLWHHQHHFKPIPGGVEMTDIVHYEIPFGFIGRWANALFVRRQLEGIFRYRFEVVEKMFGIYAPLV